jgi:Tol biopolymer transport system component/DNA-binding winged helix-turn-helix (wHTH) protein
MGSNGSDRVQFGPFEADLHTHELWKFGTRIKLVGQPFEVLAILLSKPGELVTRDALRERLWPGDTFVDFNHGLNAAVNKLREALSDSADNPRYVETLPRRGYRFIAAVTRSSNIPATVASEPVPQPETSVRVKEPPCFEIPTFAGVEEQEEQAVPKNRRRWYFAAAIVVAAFVFFHAAIWLFNQVSTIAGARDRYTAGQHIRPLTTVSAETSEPSFSPDGNYIAFRVEGSKPQEGGVFVKAVGSDQMVQVTKNAGDCCPAWSPDGQTLAFSRFTENEFQIYTVLLAQTPDGAWKVGAEKKLNTSGITPRRGEVAWSPDGKTLAFSGGAGIILLNPTDASAHRLTEPPPLAEDWGPSFSPDGKRVLFVRSRDTGFSEEIMTIPVYGGSVARVASEPARILGPPQWSFDGQSVIFASDRNSHPALWRVSLTDEAPIAINDSGWYPAVSRKGYKLAYQRVTRSLNVWEMSLVEKQKHILIPSTSETDQGPGPQLSPDGTKIAYMSDRSGTMEIWVSDQDGRNPLQLSAIGSAGTPRWSPDGQSIAFDARTKNGVYIYTVTLREGVPKLLVGDTRENICPSWSPDGKWVYFVSSRTGGWQVWKVPADGGTPSQVTTLGGHAPFASADGKFIYYAKTAYANPEIWQVPVDGGTEHLVSPMLRPATWASWAVTDDGIMFAGPSGIGRPVLSLYDVGKRKVNVLGELDTVPFWLGASKDAERVVFDQPGWEQAQIMLVENFR